MQTPGQQGYSFYFWSHKNKLVEINIYANKSKNLSVKVNFCLRKIIRLQSGRYESLAFTIWREISRSLKEFLFMQPSISSFDMVIFPELATGAGLLSGTRTDHFTNRMRHAGPGTVNTLPPYMYHWRFYFMATISVKKGKNVARKARYRHVRPRVRGTACM